MLLGGAIGSSADSGSSSVGSSVGNYVQEHDLSVYIPDFVWMALVFLAAILSIYAVVCFVVGGTVQLGYAKFNLALVDHREARFSDLFSQFGRFGDGFLLNLLTNLFIVLWSLLLIIPGIIAAYSYAMAPYILYENPGMRPMAALKASKELMRGNKWRLFCLQFSFRAARHPVSMHTNPQTRAAALPITGTRQSMPGASAYARTLNIREKSALSGATIRHVR